MDINVVIRKGMIYTALTLSVGGIYALVVGLFTALFGVSRLAGINNVFVNGLAGLIIALVFSSLREKIQ
jgi:hypothetical protein